MSPVHADYVLRRDPDNAVLGGVCAGIARRLGTDPAIPRVGFVVIAIGTSGIGVLVYLLLWAVIPAETGERAAPRRRRHRGSWRIATGVGLLALSVVLAFRELGLWWSDALVWPLVLAAFGVTLLWSLSRPTPEEPEAAPAADGARRVRASRRAAGRLSLAGFGIALVLGAGLLFLWTKGVLDAAGDVALAALVVILGLGLILAPLLWRFARSLAAERAERIRSQERAELSAHLHDSVLQTLALVQHRADDSGVAQLARRQERELRAWLAGAPPLQPDERVADALRAAAIDIEETRGTPIEVVVVGDCPLDERLEALVAAAREALTNAAKFAADGPIRLYAEIEDDRVTAYVDDRGEGFDLKRVPDDRRGIRESIIGRMERQGGQAEVRSHPGRGTEVELSVGRER